MMQTIFDSRLTLLVWPETSLKSTAPEVEPPQLAHSTSLHMMRSRNIFLASHLDRLTADGKEPSILVEIRHGRRTEDDALLGNAVRKAEQLKVDIPHLEMLYVLAKARDSATLKNEHWKPIATVAQVRCHYLDTQRGLSHLGGNVNALLSGPFEHDVTILCVPIVYAIQDNEMFRKVFRVVERIVLLWRFPANIYDVRPIERLSRFLPFEQLLQWSWTCFHRLENRPSSAT